eukprot:TRINITY_DN93993_c0_g1_i1.p1 TRINITY_DN93993_c0_g1~~TRINITY_DN93993_c0_g1_i1.p1  ORF type:complete len:165 (-),score=35.45 TRINITY_DN93993_c0_g1_i1:28-522(-)
MRASSRLLAGNVEKRLAGLGVKVPHAAAPAANYLPWVRSANLLYISGQIPKQEDNSLLQGQLGRNCSLDEGKAAARLCGLHLVGQMKAACDGDLDKVKRILKVEAFVSSTPDFVDHPQVVNGCSDLLVEIFGREVGAHSRFAVGCSSLPLGVSVEIGAVVELEE